MVSFRSRQTVLIIVITAVLCIAVLLAAGLSGRLNMDGIKYTAKTILRGSVDPAKVDTGLPVIRINTKNGKAVTSKEEYTAADIEIFDPAGSVHNIKTEVDIRGRGNTTWNAPKKPYRIRFPKKTSVFGLAPARSWVLLANYQDTTLFLNSAAFKLGELFDFPFTPHYVHVELILNGRYEGSYVLTEQIQAGKGRVDINDNSFFVELDSYYDEEPKFLTNILELPVMIKHPEDLTEDSGYYFVRDALNEFETALFADTFPDSGYCDLLDLDTWIDYIMINEITRNIDIQFPHSVYLYKDGKTDSKICLGPLWDFDYGFDYNGDRYFDRYFNDATGMYYNTVFREGVGQKFFSRFFDDPFFRKKYKERWNEKYHAVAGVEIFFDQMAAMLEESQKLNSRVWWWNKVDYKKEIERMKTWWRNRIEYLNMEINKF